MNGGVFMANLQVRDLDDRIYEGLKQAARNSKRSLSQEVTMLLEAALNAPRSEIANATLEFLALDNAWVDERDTDTVIDEIRASRSPSSRFGGGRGLFD